ncbi:methionine synthase, partial [Paenibacillus sepulcri]|nr:methionine synthase [Paenibacillus sepulcri]
SPEYDGLVLYAKDAMDGLDIANKLMNPEFRQAYEDDLAAFKAAGSVEEEVKKPLPELTRATRSNVSTDKPVFIPPDLDRHVLRNVPIPQIVPYVNMQMLLGHHLGLKGSVEQLLAEKNSKAVQLKETVDSILMEAAAKGTLHAHGMYRFFPAQSSGNDIIIYDPAEPGREIKRFSFPRQQVAPFLCLADFLKSVDSGIMDYVGFLVVTAGEGVRELAGQLKDNGDYLRSHAYQSVALEVAEG